MSLPFKQPPPEILLKIFKFALPPAVFLNASLAIGPSSPWCLTQRTKKCIVLVCKLWCQTGTFLLYQDIRLRRIGHVAALLNTLQGSAPLRMLIKAIHITCEITPQYTLMFDEALRRILEMTPNTTCLSLNMGAYDALAMSIRKYDLSKVVHLEIDGVHFLEVLPCLAQCKNLTILSIETIRGVIDIDTLTLECLQELRMSFSSTSLGLLDVIARKWTMPCLRCFAGHHDTPAPDSGMEYIQFLDVYGRHLATLSLTATWVEMSPCVLDVQMLLDRCPALEHLVLVSPTSKNLECTFKMSHECLRWIDIWAQWYSSMFASDFAPDSMYIAPDPDDVLSALKAQDFPQLQAVRLFDRALFDATIPHLPLLIPPQSVQHRETLRWRFPGIDIQDYGEKIYREDMKYVPSSTADCDGYARESDPMADSDDDQSSGSVSSPSYSAYDSEEGDLEMLEDFTYLSDGIPRTRQA
ncbi:hypothetical protein AZE42_00087 [Rhizopogon vesiculosus]|uniref:F-box domain-containing protein n=1 Tax=Rhizopogon vesiculosus TaxID=180088 RepID=A0A1J8Q3E7_9AGAM|nr:hypothetical protein AZE42_00087 [Rhizopogon vesiculosus]